MINNRSFSYACFLLFFFYHAVALSQPFVVGITEFYPPYVMRSTTKTAYGFDISLMKQICQIAKLNCQFKQLPFEGLLTAVKKGEVDCAISSLVITKHRLKSFAFSIPYLKSNGRYLANHKATFSLITRKLLESKKIGLQKKSAYVSYIKSLKLEKAHIVYYKTRMDQINALTENKIDIILMDNEAARYWINRSHNTIKAVGAAFPVGEGLGIAVASKAKAYLPVINKAIYSLYKQGKVKKLYTQYFQ